MNRNFEQVQVKYTGKRDYSARVFVYVDGNKYKGDGYILGPGTVVTMYRYEAEVLTGAIAPVVDGETGNVKTGFVVVAYLGQSGLTGESFEIVEAQEDQPETKRKKRQPEEVLPTEQTASA